MVVVVASNRKCINCSGGWGQVGVTGGREREGEKNYTMHHRLLASGIHHHINGCPSRCMTHMKLLRSIADSALLYR